MPDKKETEIVEAPETEIVEQPEVTPEQPKDADALAAELEAAREALKKANREAAERRKKLEAYEEADKKRKESEMSEIDRIKAQYEEAQAKATKLERESLQRKAADEAGLPVAFVDRIKGETLEDMVTDAKGLLEAMPKPGKHTPNISTTNPGAGASAKETDEQRLARLHLR